MRRTLGTRILAAVMAPWLAVVLAEPAALHECAMHSGHAVHAPATHAQEMSSHAAAMPSSHQGATTPASRHDASAKYCTCLGGCCAALSVTLPRAATLAWVPAAVLDEVRAEAPAFVVRAAAGYLLPFANGPPASRV